MRASKNADVIAREAADARAFLSDSPHSVRHTLRVCIGGAAAQPPHAFAQPEQSSERAVASAPAQLAARFLSYGAAAPRRSPTTPLKLSRGCFVARRPSRLEQRDPHGSRCCRRLPPRSLAAKR
jgi:hypothetical protein